MSYSRAKVSKFVRDAERALEAPDLLQFVLSVIFPRPTVQVPTAALLVPDDGEEGLAARWARLGTWEKANAVYTLTPIVERVVLDRAKVFAAAAREEETK